MNNESIIIYGEYCHDILQRFTPLVGAVRGHFSECRIIGTFWLGGKIRRDDSEIAPFDELHTFSTPAAAAQYAGKLSSRDLLVFLQHNPSDHDCMMYSAIKAAGLDAAILFRNVQSLSAYLAAGMDDESAAAARLAQVSRAERIDRVKTLLLGALVSTVVTTGRIFGASGGSGKETPRRILFLRLDLLGDMIITMPYLAAVKRKFPDAELTVMASPRGAAILREQNSTANGMLFDHLEVWNAPWHRMVPTFLGLKELREILVQLPRLWRSRFDIVVQPVNFGTGVAFALLCLGKRIIAPVDSRLPLSLRIRRYLSDPVDLPLDRILHINDLLALIAVKLDISADSLPNVLHVDPAALEKMRELLLRGGHNAGKRIILVNLGAGNSLRRWGSDKFGALVGRLLQDQVTVVLTSGKDERVIANEVVTANGGSLVNTAGNLSLNELIALASLSDLVITADTAVMHLASALDLPIVALFGAGLLDYCRPLSRNYVVVKKELGCSGCRDSCFAAALPPPCLEQVTPESVYQATKGMLEKICKLHTEGKVKC